MTDIVCKPVCTVCGKESETVISSPADKITYLLHCEYCQSKVQVPVGKGPAVEMIIGIHMQEIIESLNDINLNANMTIHLKFESGDDLYLSYKGRK